MRFPRSLALLLALTGSAAAAESLTVAQLIARAETVSPTLERSAAQRALGAARLNQATVWANPALELRAGRARYRDGGAAVGTYGVELRQRLPLPGRRGAAAAAARAAASADEAETVVRERQLAAEVRAAALMVAVAAEEVHLAASGATLAEEIRVVAARHRAAGEGSAAGEAQAELEAATAALAREAAERRLAQAREALATWCGPLPTDLLIPDILPADATEPVPEAPSPELAALGARIAAAEAQVVTEQRAWWPEIELGVSADRAADTNDLGVSLGIELPLWDRNSGAIEAARAEARIQRAEAALRTAELRRTRAAAVAAVALAHSELAGLRTRALPVAEKALRLHLTAFTAGEIPLTEVQQARRTLLALEQAVLSARQRAAEAQLALSTIGTQP